MSRRKPTRNVIGVIVCTKASGHRSGNLSEVVLLQECLFPFWSRFDFEVIVELICKVVGPPILRVYDFDNGRLFLVEGSKPILRIILPGAGVPDAVSLHREEWDNTRPECNDCSQQRE